MDIDRYGPVALLAGAAEGLGGAFAIPCCAPDCAHLDWSRGPCVMSGWLHGLAQWLVGRLLPRRHALALMDPNTQRLS